MSSQPHMALVKFSVYLLSFAPLSVEALREASQAVPSLLSKQDVICLDSSGEEDEQEEPHLPPLPVRPIREGMIEERKRLSFFPVHYYVSNSRSS